MKQNHPGEAAPPTISKLKLALGAAGLFLFLVGVKRSYRIDETKEIREDPARAKA
jgi:hypothetical protein